MDQSERTLDTSLVLCAFFEKRMRVNSIDPLGGPNAEPLSQILFGPFWKVRGGRPFNPAVDPLSGAREDPETGLKAEPLGQWKVPAAWHERAAADGSGEALLLLQFRVNRMCKLLSVSDCWASNIGKHIAHWLDSHMHLVLACEKRESGPQPEDAQMSTNLSLCDWRKKSERLNAGLRSSLFGGDRVDDKICQLYLRVFTNMAACKSLSSLLRPLAANNLAREAICSSVTRSMLGMNAIKACFEVRRSVHATIQTGTVNMMDTLMEAAAVSERPVIFMCMREHVAKCISDDISLNTLAQSLSRLKMFVANVASTMNGLLMALNIMVPEARPTKDYRPLNIFHWVTTVQDDRLMFFPRCAKRTPGPVARTLDQKTTLSNTTRIIRRLRDRAKSEKAIVTENFFDPKGLGCQGLTDMFNGLGAKGPVLQPGLDWGIVRDKLKRAGALAHFTTLVDTMFQGSSALESFFTKSGHEETFRVASDCLELVQVANTVRVYELPAALHALQRRAVMKRFSDTTCKEPEIMMRASEIIWCASCKKIKNFIIEEGVRKEPAYGSHGYKRICHSDEGILCDERRLFECCKTVPLKHISLIKHGQAFCAEICGRAYMLTTCCGRIALFDKLHALPHSPLMCNVCYLAETTPIETKAHTKNCHFCEAIVERKKGTYTGMFTDDEGLSKSLTFCKRHTRPFMKRDREPMILDEVMLEIPKRLRY